LSIVELDGVTAIESSVGPLVFSTLRLVPVVCVRLPLVPVMVNGKVPVGEFAGVVMLSVDVPEPVTVGGLNVPVAPEGNPVTENVTVPLNALIPATVVVKVVPAPCRIDCEAGAAETVKSGVDDPVTVRTVEPLTVPEVA